MTGSSNEELQRDLLRRALDFYKIIAMDIIAHCSETVISEKKIYELRHKLPSLCDKDGNVIAKTPLDILKRNSVGISQDVNIALTILGNVDLIWSMFASRSYDSEKALCASFAIAQHYQDISVRFKANSITGYYETTLKENEKYIETGKRTFTSLAEGREKKWGKKRALYAEAAEIAKRKWESGSNEKHNEMTLWLLEDYSPDGKNCPFMGLSEESLRNALKKVLYEMGRKDLIWGFKKP